VCGGPGTQRCHESRFKSCLNGALHSEGVKSEHVQGESKLDILTTAHHRRLKFVTPVIPKKDIILFLALNLAGEIDSGVVQELCLSMRTLLMFSA